jgi:hypothetical protein
MEGVGVMTLEAYAGYAKAETLCEIIARRRGRRRRSRVWR